MELDLSLADEVNKEISRIQNADRVKVFENEVNTEVVENLHGKATAREFTFCIRLISLLTSS
ncbi:MAG: hypothetical protein R3324_17590, partial [Halobacteriales archaeon]|nr:hypothetical protein [Halobacteriales archaeon]